MAAGPSVRELSDDVQEAPETPAPTSLVLYRESVGEIGPTYCPKKPLDLVALERPDLRFPASCDAYWCDVCGPAKARQCAALMTWSLRRAQARRLVTLTKLPCREDGQLDWGRARGQVRDLVYRVRAAGYSWEWSWAVERNPRGTGFHAHGVQWGNYVPQRELADMWGGRRVDIRMLSKPGAGVYAVKEALTVAGYVVKGGTEDPSRLPDHLERNGGRAAHWSRGFLHGLTKREALSELRRELANGEQLTWVLAPPGREPGVSLVPIPSRSELTNGASRVGPAAAGALRASS